MCFFYLIRKHPTVKFRESVSSFSFRITVHVKIQRLGRANFLQQRLSSDYSTNCKPGSEWHDRCILSVKVADLTVFKTEVRKNGHQQVSIQNTGNELRTIGRQIYLPLSGFLFTLKKLLCISRERISWSYRIGPVVFIEKRRFSFVNLIVCATKSETYYGVFAQQTQTQTLA